MKSEEKDRILDWFRNTTEWGKSAYQKYKTLFRETGDCKLLDLETKAVATAAAPWALSWTQYSIGECYEYLKQFDEALAAYKKGFNLWVEVNGWNGDGPILDLFKRGLIILSKLKDKDKFKEYEIWLLNLLGKCPKDISDFYTARVHEELMKRMNKLRESDK